MLTQKEPNFFKGYSFPEKLFSYITIVGTGGSTSVSDGYNNMRYAGATAREMLKQAAADAWGVEVTQCAVKSGFVINKSNQDRMAYGALAAAASQIKVAELPKLKEKKDWKLLGKPVRRLDIPEKVNGSATFGLDVRMPNLLYASFRHPSVIGASVTGIKNQEVIAGKKGVKKSSPYGIWCCRNC